MDFLTV